jgi:hypothetical protein
VPVAAAITIAVSVSSAIAIAVSPAVAVAIPTAVAIAGVGKRPIDAKASARQSGRKCQRGRKREH